MARPRESVNVLAAGTTLQTHGACAWPYLALKIIDPIEQRLPFLPPAARTKACTQRAVIINHMIIIINHRMKHRMKHRSNERCLPCLPCAAYATKHNTYRRQHLPEGFKLQLDKRRCLRHVLKLAIQLLGLSQQTI